MVEVYLGLNKPATITISIMEFIILVTMVDMYPGIKIPATLSLTIAEQELMFTGDVDIKLRQVNLPPTTKVDVADC